MNRWGKRLVCFLRGHRFHTAFWPDLEPGGFVCSRCGLTNRCPCQMCVQRWELLDAKPVEESS